MNIKLGRVATEPRLSIPDSQILDRLQRRTMTVLSESLPANARDSGVAILDFPSHQNVGDSMIWQGERAYLRRLGVPVRFISDIGRAAVETIDALDPEIPILIHGGGNFGDLWPRFQSFREMIIDRFVDREIVQLPQSVFYADASNAKRSRRIMERHPRLTLLFRERESVQRASDYFPACLVRLCPDSAFGIGAIANASKRADNETLVLSRKDHEVGGSLDALLVPDSSTKDWKLSGWDEALWRLNRAPHMFERIAPSGLKRGAHRLSEFSYENMASLNVSAGVELFRGYRFVVTNRLHAHVLAILMGLPHVVVDNNYGKIGAVFREYSGDFASATLTSDISRIPQLLNDLRASSS